MSTLVVGISDIKLSSAPDLLVTYALGSCVGTCLYDKTVQVGGLSHIMLPDSSMAASAGQIYRFADTAIVELVRLMEQKGARRVRMTAKIAGGAQMFAAMANSSISNIGDRNVAAVKAALTQLRIPIIAEDTGKNYGRTQTFDLKDGSMRIKSVNRGEVVW